MKLTPPAPEEYAPYYGAYVGPATARRDVLAALPKQIDELNAALGKFTDEQARFKFGPAEWSIKELVGHLNDVERIFSYRLLCISRNDKTPLPGFEQDDYVREASFDDRPLGELLAEFEHLRRANILAIKNMSETAIDQRGTASGYTFSARALIYILVGHVEHHMTSLHENYLSAMKS
ncbi:MAG: DinB family protein [Anaerolineales bacterium]|uniref:DinB family protein n=1 Tax=Candidatus Villigracilis proximus TaxID=3140683 RepID=UPI0031367E0D|nr:DinB family protein [Anaerolineales bacterium]